MAAAEQVQSLQGSGWPPSKGIVCVCTACSEGLERAYFTVFLCRSKSPLSGNKKLVAENTAQS
jgi:hypothetical protein